MQSFGGVSNLNNRRDEGGGGRKRAQGEDTRLSFTDPACLKIHWKVTRSKASSQCSWDVLRPLQPKVQAQGSAKGQREPSQPPKTPTQLPQSSAGLEFTYPKKKKNPPKKLNMFKKPQNAAYAKPMLKVL